MCAFPELVAIGQFSNQCFHTQFPNTIVSSQQYSISSKELLAIIVALRLWGGHMQGSRILLHCNNRHSRNFCVLFGISAPHMIWIYMLSIFPVIVMPRQTCSVTGVHTLQFPLPIMTYLLLLTMHSLIARYRCLICLMISQIFAEFIVAVLFCCQELFLVHRSPSAPYLVPQYAR